MISSVTNAKELGVVESLRPSSAPMSPVCSIIARVVGRRSTHGPVESTINPWSKKALTDLAQFHSDGVKPLLSHMDLWHTEFIWCKFLFLEILDIYFLNFTLAVSLQCCPNSQPVYRICDGKIILLF